MRVVFWMLATLAMGKLCAGCTAGSAPPRLALEFDDEDALTALPAPVVPQAMAPRAAVPTLDVPDRCDRLIVVDTPSGPQLSKERPRWLLDRRVRAARQAEIKRVIAAVADVMGADSTAAEMIWRKAIYESSANAGNIHIRSRDVAANRSAAGKGRRRAAKRWRRAMVPVYRKHRGRLAKVGGFDAWALGRGLYGQVSGLHAHWWSPDAPPWSLCDPIIATATVIWSMRAGLEECHGSTLRDAYRRFSSGKCALRSDKLERRFDRLARGHVRALRLPDFDPDAPARLGTRWPHETSDRRALLAAVHAHLAAQHDAPAHP